MRKKVMKKFLATMLITIMFVLFTMNSSAFAVNKEETNYTVDEILTSNEKIMKYDVMTGETTEVDIEELKQVVYSQRNIDESSLTSIAPYDPILLKGQNKITNNVVTRDANSAQRITDTYSFPNRVTCRIVANDSSGNTIFGTAAIVGPSTGLTAAHCVFDVNDNNAVYSNWTIYPGYNNGTYYGTACGWSQVYYSSEWMNSHSDQYDWAICVLQSDVGNQLGWFGTQSYGTNSELNNTEVSVLGYPCDTNYGFIWDARYQYETGERITSVGTRYFRYSAWTFGGFSGGPIKRNDNYIVGIHYGLVWNTSTGVRITQEMIDIIRSLNG